MSPLVGVLLLVLVTVIWGSTFAVIKETIQTVPVPILLAVRFSFAALFLLWVKPERKTLIPGLILGLLSFAGYATQTIGMLTTTASKAAFITELERDLNADRRGDLAAPEGALAGMARGDLSTHWPWADDAQPH
jgi:drug/metabolite transporter (DMT)-like permease